MRNFAHLIGDAYSVVCCVNCEVSQNYLSVLDASSASVVAHSIRTINPDERPGYKDASVLVNLIIPKTLWVKKKNPIAKRCYETWIKAKAVEIRYLAYKKIWCVPYLEQDNFPENKENFPIGIQYCNAILKKSIITIFHSLLIKDIP